MSSLPITSVFNDGYIAQMYEDYRRDPASVDESWRQFFKAAAAFGGVGGGGAATAPGAPADATLLRAAAGAADLIGAIQRYGHLAVQIDPLGSPPPGAAELTPEFHGVTAAQLQQLPASAVGRGDGGTAADKVERMRQLYCGAIGYEFEHLGAEDEREWFRRTIEDGSLTAPLSADEKKLVLQRLTEVDGLERFLGLAYVSVKRFSIEGVDALVPMLDEAIERGAAAGARVAVIGMAHRGRLNVLTNVIGKPYKALLEEFEGHHPASNAESDTGDVKYHLGYSGSRDVPGVGTVSVELVPNPSHLELVNPVVAGVTRARQRIAGGAPYARDAAAALPILVHGDASFSGEGVVPETLNMSLLAGFTVGGTLHIISNNQIGFTTDPTDARSTHYASDIAKGFDVPILHVNGDDAEACIQAVRLGIAYRQRFAKDIVIDVVGYRRHGHNEADQPAFTQPVMYKAIAEHPTPREVWGARLVRERIVTEDEVKAVDKAFADRLQAIYQEIKHAGSADASDGPGEAGAARNESAIPATAVRAERLVSLNEQLLSWPSDLTLHPTIQRTLPRRRDAITSGAIDWGHAESLAFASLITEGVNLRITGQDVERGTFSHRQAVLHDVNSGQAYTPLANLPQAEAAFEIYNSPLSETAVLAFEYGFSVAAGDALVLWEAQFGDFVNVAQPVIDQFIAAGRAKWRQESGLVLLLPHGYEGQGPEHSSARLERFLQLSAEGNIVVAYPSTPAQYFHVLRRQASRARVRPLVLMQPKSLLRLPAANSRLEDLASGGFQPVIDDPTGASRREAVQRLVFCTGKIYYDLTAAGDRPDNVALIRVEELSPWPREIGDIVDRYPNVSEVAWAQEEPRNMGAWTYVQPRLRASIGTLTTLRYIGRTERASPAEGYKSTHDAEQARIVSDALTYVPAPARRSAEAGRGS
jgi:2-oxoglutarate dehydrogenase E1 component